jgi:subtilisin family serine protease
MLIGDLILGDFKGVIAVGATDVNDMLARFSSRGPGKHLMPLTPLTMNLGPIPKKGQSDNNGTFLFARQKPDISAPGTMIPAALTLGVRVVSAYHKGNASYTTMSGTSMATPHVAGVIALMLSAGSSPSLKFQTGAASSTEELTFDDVRSILISTAVHENLPAPNGGAGRTVPLPGWPESRKCDGSSWDVWPNLFYGYGRIDAERAVVEAMRLAVA